MKFASALSLLLAALPLLLVYALLLTPYVKVSFLLLCLITLISYVRAQKQPLVQWPVLRHLPTLLCNVHHLNEWGTELFTALGCGTVRLKGPMFTGLELILTCDPLNVEYVTKTNFANFGKGPTFVEKFDILGDGIFNADEQSWFVQRKMAHSRFMSKKFQSFYTDKSREVAMEGLVPVLQHAATHGSPLDLQEVFKRFSFDASCASIMGTNPRSLSVSFAKIEFSTAIDVATQSVLYRHLVPSFWWKVMRFLGIGWEGRYAQSWRTIEDHLAKYISLKRQDLENGKGGDDMLSMYMSHIHRDEEEEKFILPRGDSFFRDTALTFFVAGRDTVGSGLSWFFMLLCKTPSVEAKILEELRLVVFGGNTQEAKNKRPWCCSSEDLKKLVYLHAAILESMRLYPPVPVEHKGIREADVLPDGTVVKPGMSIIYSIYVMGRMKWIWGDDCLDFKPERWIDEKGKLRNQSSSKYAVFNAGPRTCLGKNMALTLMKMGAATVLLNFQTEMVEKQPICQVPSVTLQIKNGLMVRVTERDELSN
ncbi:alkane hydroxylase MAH1-like [Aristolochia californica]|uniref:alkane hydroxylase MAH1-like n=1 Tax=Aristolochia californica TaxID=171875 RepID=UPI0035DC0FDF